MYPTITISLLGLAVLLVAAACPEEVVNGVLQSSGSLLDDSGKVYPPGDFWRATDTDGVVVFYRTCPCNQKPCVRKCCPGGRFYSEGHHGCVDSNTTNIHDKLFSDFNVNTGVVCDAKYRLNEDENFTLDVNELHLVYGDGTEEFFSVEQFCMEVYASNDSIAITPLMCFPDEPVVDSRVVYSSFMIISEPFLLATILVYALIPELRTLAGKCLMCQVSALFVAFLFLIIIKLASDILPIQACVGMAFILHFAFLASFFWLNIMCFDMWWTFSGVQRMRGSGKRLERKKFILYSAYAWGCPFIMLIVCLVMQFFADPDIYITPKFGEGTCWFGDDKAIFAYFYGPVAVLVFANLVMFITTALKILKLKRETAMLKHTDSRRHDEDGNNKERFSLYLKLFVVMGVNWGMEVLSWATGGPEYLWYVTDLGNTLQGVLIFFIFVWKDKIKRLLVRRFSKTAAVNGRSSKSSTRTSARTSTRVTSLNSSCFTDTANTYPLVHSSGVVA